MWCFNCLLNKPPKIVKAAFLIPKRDNHYWTDDRDKKLVGVCDKCLEFENDFKKSNKIGVDVNNPNLHRSCM